VIVTAHGQKALQKQNLTSVTLTHMGGDNIDITQFHATVDGDQNVYRNSKNYKSYGADIQVTPLPNIFESYGSDDPVLFDSGQRMNVVS